MFKMHPLRSSVNLLSSSAWKIYRNRSCELITMRDLSTTFPSPFLMKMISGGMWKIIILADDKWTKKRIKDFDLYSSFHQSSVVAIRCVAEAVVVVNFSFYFFFSLSLFREKPTRGQRPSACRCFSRCARHLAPGKNDLH